MAREGGRQANGKSRGDQWEEKGDQFLLRQGKDYDHGAITHDRFGIIDDADGSYWGNAKLDSWRPGPLRAGNNARPKPTGYHDCDPVEPISRTSKGQRATLGKSRGDRWEE